MSHSVRTTIVLPEDRLRTLRRLAFERRGSIGKLINEAIEKVFFRKTGSKNFSSLRGIWKNAGLDEGDFQDLKKRLRDSHL